MWRKAALVCAFIACAPAANWLIANWGAVCVPRGPCLIPVAPGLMAPSGVLLIGAALVLRDEMHERLGRWPTLAAMLAAGGDYVVARTLDDVAFALAGWGVPLRCRLLPFLAADAVRAERRRRAA